MRTFVRSGVVVVLSLLVVLAGTRLSAQEPAPPPPPPRQPEPASPPDDQKAEEVVKEAEPTEEEMKEEEPATPAEKMKKEEIEKRACPAKDVGYRANTDKTTHPTPEPAADKSLVYVLRPTMMGSKIQSKLAVDGEWVGVNRGHNYFFLTLAPGEHFFCSKAENRSTLAASLEAGKTYFLEQKIKMGFMKARNKLALLPDAEGRAKLAKCHPSVFEAKK
jgi:outer membrane biosynthesis protein TonB